MFDPSIALVAYPSISASILFPKIGCPYRRLRPLSPKRWRDTQTTDITGLCSNELLFLHYINVGRCFGVDWNNYKPTVYLSEWYENGTMLWPFHGVYRHLAAIELTDYSAYVDATAKVSLICLNAPFYPGWPGRTASKGEPPSSKYSTLCFYTVGTFLCSIGFTGERHRHSSHLQHSYGNTLYSLVRSLSSRSNISLINR